MKALRKSLLLGLIVCWMPLVALAALDRQNHLLGKFFVSAVNGTVSCVTDGRIIDLKKGDTIMGRGAIVETAADSNATLVFSNGTGIYTDEKTRFEIEKFDQEFFTPNNNLRVEPSNSSTIVKLATGRVVISTPRLLSGTTMVYETPQAMVGVRGEKLMIETSEKQTHVAMIAGNATVNPRDANGDFVSIGKRLTSGQEAFVKYTLGGTAIAEEDFVAATADAAAAPADPEATGPLEPALIAAADAPLAPPAPPPAPKLSANATTADAQATVLRLTGMATVRLAPGGAETSLAEGANVPVGAQIYTGEASEIHLQPFDGTIATVRPNSSVIIEKLALTTDEGAVKKQTAILDLKAGTVVSIIDPAKRAINDYGVRTPKGIASAKGTSFAISVENDGFAVTTTADTVTFVTDTGETYSITAGNVTISPPGGEPQPPISLVDALAANPSFAQTIQTALNAVTHVIQNNLGSLSPASATDLLAKVAHTAATALPGQASAIAAQAIAAINWPDSSTSSSVAASTAAVIEAIASAAPTLAAQIATAAVLAAPDQAIVIAAAAARGSPSQSAQVASAITLTLVQTGSDGNVTTASLQAATAVAAAITASVPTQAAPVAAAVMQALAQSAPLATPLMNALTAATIASAVTNAAPSQAVPVAAQMMSALKQTPGFSDASSQVVAQSAATLAAAVTVVVPPQAQEVATAVMQLLMQPGSGITPAAAAQAAGLIAAAVGYVAPDRAGAVAQALAETANLPLVTVQANAAQSGPTVAQIAQQLALIGNAASAATRASMLASNAAAQAPSNVPTSGFLGAGSGGTPGESGSNSTTPNLAGSGTTPPPDENTSSSIIISQFDPGGIADLTAALEAAQAGQGGVQFSPDTTAGTGGVGGGSSPPSVTPIPVVPPVLDSNLVTSPANLNG